MTASAFIRASVALLFCMAAAVTDDARAQIYDGAGLLRFGAFGQVGSHAFDIQQPAEADVVGSLSSASGGGGITYGYDWLFHAGWLLGVESDIAFDTWSEQRGVREYSLDYVVTLRGRLGAYARPDLLIYGTAGLAGLGVGYKGLPDLFTGNRFTENQTLVGWTVGGGLEYDWHGFALFGEYLYASYETLEFFEVREFELGPAVLRNEVDIDQHLIRLGVKFIIGHDHRERYPGYGGYGPVK